ncbi:MAG: NADPH-dependent F420 reductase [Dehalococcoidia bacterium]
MASMQIGIIGAGHIGATVAGLFVKAGHEVAVSNSRGPESIASLVSEIGPTARATTVEEAASFGEVVLLAIPWRGLDGLPSPQTLAGKIVIDAMNPYSANFEIVDLGDSTSSEEVAKRLPGARIVKAFNTMYFEMLRTGGQVSVKDRLVLFVAGDDTGAKDAVSRLIDEIGFASVDTGTIREGGRRQQPGSPIYNKPMTVDQARAALAAAP